MHYGDIEDPDLWDSLPLKHTNCIINTVSDYPHAVSMMKSLKSKGYEGHVYITANRKEDYELMKDIGADQVLWPHQMAASNFYNMFIDDKK